MARPSLESLDAFVHIVEAGSLSGAARQLGLAKSVLSDRLANLEATLGVTLARRTTRRLAITEAGERFFQQAQRILEQVDEASDAAVESAGAHGALRGRLRVAAPVSFGAAHLGQLLMPFLAAHPGLHCQIELNDGVVDLLAGHFDLAVRIGRLPDSRLVARRLGDIPRWVCASPAYLQRHGTPNTTEALRQHAVLGYSHAGAARLWTFAKRDGQPFVASIGQARFTANNGELLRDAAVAGLGLVILPRFFVATAVARGELRHLPLNCEPVPDGLHLVYPAQPQLPRRTRAALDYLAEALRGWVHARA